MKILKIVIMEESDGHMRKVQFEGEHSIIELSTEMITAMTFLPQLREFKFS